MRQFLTLRYWLTVLALVSLLVLLTRCTGGDESIGSGDGLAVTGDVHRIDLVAPVERVVAPLGFAMVDGRTNIDIEVVLDATRTMRIAAGTPGVLDCPTFYEPGQCVVGADLLGDAVLWFGMLDGTGSTTVRLPGIVELLEDQEVRLANGWVVVRSSTVTRTCDEETTSLKDFVTRFGERSTTTFEIDRQQVVRITCAP